MSDDDLIGDEFIIEANELLDSAEESLLLIEKDEEMENNYNNIYRTFHSLKGAAGMFGLERLQRHMHKLEDQFESFKGKDSFCSNHIEYFLSGIDGAKTILRNEELEFDYTLLFKEDGDNLEKTNKNIKDLPSTKNVIMKKSENEKEGGSTQKKKTGGKDFLFNVFIIDDEPAICEIISETIEELGIGFYIFNDAREALKQIEEEKPNVILSDLHMPEMTGIEFLESVNERDIRIPIIFVSGFLSKDIIIQGHDNGVYAFLEKPFSESNLINHVHNAISNYENQRMLTKLTNMIIYQFADLDEYLKSQGKNRLRKILKEDIHDLMILKAKNKKVA